jgi:hypothetical protein
MHVNKHSSLLLKKSFIKSILELKLLEGKIIASFNDEKYKDQNPVFTVSFKKTFWKTFFNEQSL